MSQHLAEQQKDPPNLASGMPSSPGVPRQWPECRTFNGKTRKVLGKPRWGVTPSESQPCEPGHPSLALIPLRWDMTLAGSSRDLKRKAPNMPSALRRPLTNSSYYYYYERFENEIFNHIFLALLAAEMPPSA